MLKKILNETEDVIRDVISTRVDKLRYEILNDKTVSECHAFYIRARLAEALTIMTTLGFLDCLVATSIGVDIDQYIEKNYGSRFMEKRVLGEEKLVIAKHNR